MAITTINVPITSSSHAQISDVVFTDVVTPTTSSADTNNDNDMVIIPDVSSSLSRQNSSISSSAYELKSGQEDGAPSKQQQFLEVSSAPSTMTKSKPEQKSGEVYV